MVHAQSRARSARWNAIRQLAALVAAVCALAAIPTLLSSKSERAWLDGTTAIEGVRPWLGLGLIVALVVVWLVAGAFWYARRGNTGRVAVCTAWAAAAFVALGGIGGHRIGVLSAEGATATKYVLVPGPGLPWLTLIGWVGSAAMISYGFAATRRP